MNKTNNHLSLQLAEHQKRPRHTMCVLVWDRHEHHCPELDLRRCATQLFSAKQVCCCIYLNGTGSNIGGNWFNWYNAGPAIVSRFYTQLLFNFNINNAYSIDLIKSRLLLYIFLYLCQVTFHSSLTVQSYARHLNILTNRTTALGVLSILKSRFVDYWSVDNMNPDTTPKEMLDVRASSQNKRQIQQTSIVSLD